MTFLKTKYQFVSYILFIVSSLAVIHAQQLEKTIIMGLVTDAKTGAPLPFVSVILKNSTVGTVTDNNGKYLIETTIKSPVIAYSFIGYQTETHPVSYGQYQTIDVKLKEESFALKEVVVKPKKQPYSNKNNTAVELIENVIRKKSENRREGFNYLKYDKYEKVQFALSKISEKDKNNILFRPYQFLLENADTTKQKGMTVLPFFMTEALSTCYYRKNPTDNKEIVKGEKTINFDEYLDNKGVMAYINYLYQNIDVYQNEIFFLTNRFLSPITQSAPLFYKYYIIDTVQLSDVKCVRMFFDARNKADFLFQGFLYITQDSTYAVRKVDMNLNNGINIDWIKNVKIVQDFVQAKEKTWMLSRDDISINFEINEKLKGVYGERTVSYTNYEINDVIPDTVFDGQTTVRKIDPQEKTEAFWNNNRPIPLSKSEKGIYTNADSIKKIPSFKLKMDAIMLLTTSFYSTKYFELGPVGSFISYNPTEGSRFRIGGRTAPGFSKKLTLDGYMAYGTKDQLYKYAAGITYSLTPRVFYEFPSEYFKLSYQYDTQIPGQELQFNQGDNVFLSFTRGVNDKLLYNRTLKVEFVNEFTNHFTYTLGFSYRQQSPGGKLYFNQTNYLLDSVRIGTINIPETSITLRYAPNETFYQGKLYRDYMPTRHPVITLKYSLGSSLLGNDYDYSRIQLNISKRFYPSILGYTDISLEAGKIFGQVPFPLLFIHNANEALVYQTYSYNMMNFLEFVSDEYAALNFDHCFNGFIFNKVPFLKKLKLREIVNLKVLYGGVTNLNDPALHSNLFKYPTELDKNNVEVPLTYTLEKKPYIEAGIGISNIFKVFRVDVVERITYVNNLNAHRFSLPLLRFRLDI